MIVRTSASAPPQAEALGEQRHLVADDGSLDERAVVDEGLHPGDEHPDPALVGLLADERQGLVGEGERVDRAGRGCASG